MDINLLGKYDDIKFVPTSQKGQVLLQAGREQDARWEQYDVSMQVPEAFAKQVIEWKNKAKMLDSIP